MSLDPYAVRRVRRGQPRKDSRAPSMSYAIRRGSISAFRETFNLRARTTIYKSLNIGGLGEQPNRTWVAAQSEGRHGDDGLPVRVRRTRASVLGRTETRGRSNCASTPETGVAALDQEWAHGPRLERRHGRGSPRRSHASRQIRRRRSSGSTPRGSQAVSRSRPGADQDRRRRRLPASGESRSAERCGAHAVSRDQAGAPPTRCGQHSCRARHRRSRTHGHSTPPGARPRTHRRR